MGFAAFLGYALNDWIQSGKDKAEAESTAPTYRFPEDVTIVRKDGTSLGVRLTGRNDTHIQFERLSDQLAFTFEIEELNTATQKLIQNYPKAGYVEPEKVAEKAPATVESYYIEQLKEEIDEIDRKLMAIQVEYASTASEATRRALRRKGEQLNAKRLKLSAEVANRTGTTLERRKPAELRDKF